MQRHKVSRRLGLVLNRLGLQSPLTLAWSGGKYGLGSKGRMCVYWERWARSYLARYKLGAITVRSILMYVLGIVTGARESLSVTQRDVTMGPSSDAAS